MAHELAAHGGEPAAAAHEEVTQLPRELWVRVLRVLPLRERSCAALVCKALRAAAAAATDSIQRRTLKQAQCDALSAWLGHSGSAAPVTSLELEGEAPKALLRLPFAQLVGLRSLSVSELGVEAAPGPAADAVAADGNSAACASLAACTALTRLECRSSYPGCHLGLAGLLELRGLRHLDLWGVVPQAGSDWDSLLSTVGAALLLRTQLTHLALPAAAEASDAALQHVSALRQLQYLSAWSVKDPTASLGALPSSLTALCLHSVRGSTVLSPGGLPGWTQLTGLQRLELQRARVQPALVAACGSRLRHLALVECQLEGAAADMAALTASSELTCLDLSGTQLPPGTAALLWPAGRLLPQLRALRDCGSLFDSAEAASGLARCCPALEEMWLNYLDVDDDELEAAPKLAPLQALTGLTHLQLQGVELSNSWEDVCGLTRLRHLVLDFMWGVSWCGLAAASRLTRLTELSCYCDDAPCWVLTLTNEAPADEPPDVCPAQLLEALVAGWQEHEGSDDERFRLLEDAVDHMRSQRQQLAASRAEAATSQQQLAAARTEAATSQQQLAAARAEVAALQARVAQLELQREGGRQ